MSYARNLLSRGEEVVFESRQHWFAVLGETWPFVIARHPGLRRPDLGVDQRHDRNQLIEHPRRSSRWWR